MAVKYRNDVTDYITPSGAPARLLVTLTPSTGIAYAVMAQIDDEPPMTGQFLVNPEWQTQTRQPQPKSYPTDPTQDVGAQLFSALFSGSLSRVWAQARERARAKGGLTIIVRTPSPQVHSLPWELLSDTTLTSSEHVAISEGWSVVRDVRDPGRGGRPDPDAPTPRTQLAVTALTTPVPGVDQESDIRILHDAFGPDAVTARKDVDPHSLLAEIASDGTNLMHIMGSGRQGRGYVQDLALDYRNPDQITVVSGRELMGAAAKADQLDLLVLAACETDQLAAQLAGVVPAVIGIRGMISNDGCQVFLAGLYHALSSGSTVTQAVAAGRAQQVSFSSSLGDEWAQPVLYLSVDAPLLLTTPSEEAPPEPVVLPDATSDDEQLSQLVVQMKQANLRELQTRWGSVEASTIPSVVTGQIESLTRELKSLRGNEP